MTQSKDHSKDGGGWTIGIPAPRVDQIPEAMRPFVEMSLKLQSECMELYGHRAKAWAEWPPTFFACRCTEDLAEAQRDYITRMQKDYAAYFDGILRDTMIEAEEYVEDDGNSETADVKHLEAA
jgi:hypothetical protein